MTGKKRSITANVFFNLLYQVLTILMPLITTPYLSRVIGAEGIGINGYTLSIVTYFVLFGSLGTAMYGQREIAKVEDNPDKYSKKFWEILIIRVLTTILSMILYYLLFCINGDHSLYYKIFLIYMIGYSLNISWFFQGLEQFDKIVIRNIIVKVVSIIAIFVLVKAPTDLWKYIAIFSISEFIGNISLWFYLPRRLTKVKISAKDLKYHIIPAISLFLPQIAVQIYTVLDKTMVGLITNDMNQVGFYEQAQNIAKAAVIIMSSVQVVMNSRVANAWAKNDIEEVKECLRKSFEFVWLVGIPLMLGIIGCAHNIIPWYYGPEFKPVEPLLIASSFLIIAIGLNGITGVVYLIHTDQQKKFTMSVILGALVNVLFNFILINIIGTIGASIASVIAESFILIYQFKYINKTYNIADIFKSSIKPLIGGLIMFVIILVYSRFLDSTMINTIKLFVLGGIVYSLSMYVLKTRMFMDALNTIVRFVKRK